LNSPSSQFSNSSLPPESLFLPKSGVVSLGFQGDPQNFLNF
jgi:hypothetical protein